MLSPNQFYPKGRWLLLAAVLLIIPACQSGGGTPAAPSAGSSSAGQPSPGTTAAPAPTSPAPGSATTGDSTGGVKTGQPDPAKPSKGDASDTAKVRADFIKDAAELAQQGKLRPVADFITVGKTTLKEARGALGEPNKSEGGYDFYSPGMMKGTIAVGYGKGDVIYELRWFGVGLDPVKDGQVLKRSEVVRVLGEPKEIRKLDKQEVLVYPRGSYELKFVFPDAASGGSDPNIDHMNVIDPKAAAKGAPA